MLPLKTTLTVNALSSGATGILLVAFAPAIAQLFGVANTMPFVATGIFLVLFGLFVFIVSRKNPPARRSVQLITTLDTLWVIGSVALVLAASASLSVTGIVLIIAVAGWVAMMALLQTKGLRTMVL